MWCTVEEMPVPLNFNSVLPTYAKGLPTFYSVPLMNSCMQGKSVARSVCNDTKSVWIVGFGSAFGTLLPASFVGRDGNSRRRTRQATNERERPRRSNLKKASGFAMSWIVLLLCCPSQSLQSFKY